MASSIPLLNLQAQYQALKPEIDRAIQQVLDRGQFILGPEVEAFERELAAYCGAAHGVGVASGTDALELALAACGIRPGDEVITSAYSFVASVTSIIAVGATPVLVDIDPQTYTLAPEAVEAALTARTRAIVPVHLYGHPCDMEALRRIADSRSLKLIEDCAQAAGAAVRGQRVGALGDAAAFSFYPTKNLGAYGDGGMVVTQDPSVADRVRLLRAHGSRERYRHDILGMNSRLDELQAAVLRVKLRHLEAWNDQRRAHAAAYRAAFERLGAPRLRIPVERPGYRHVYHLYCIRVPSRDAVRQALDVRGIGTQVAYPEPLTVQPAVQPFLASAPAAPVAHATAGDILALPMFPELSGEQIQAVASAVVASM